MNIEIDKITITWAAWWMVNKAWNM